MDKQSRMWPLIVLAILLWALILFGFFQFSRTFGPRMVSPNHTTPGVPETQMVTANDLYAAFKHVARPMKPPVVGISSVKRF